MPFFKKKLYYIVENADWSIRWDGIYITENLNRLNSNLKAGIRTDIKRIRNCIIHFGSRSTYLPGMYKHIHYSNRVVFTWFHGTPEDKKFIDELPGGARRADLIHTSCEISKRQLIDWGAEENKIRVIPLGVDLNIFKPLNKKTDIRKMLGIPDDSFVIGSFQKDGNGWGEGDTPKLIKGPDLFCDVVESLKEEKNVFVLLTGPARGYVKKRLEKAGIKYKHFYLNDYKEIPLYYNALDMYLVSSRAEGGPKAILESMACGIPLVTTKVGMAPEIILQGENGFICDVDEKNEIIHFCKRIIHKRFDENIISNALKDVNAYSWDKIAKKYYINLYQNLIGK